MDDGDPEAILIFEKPRPVEVQPREKSRLGKLTLTGFTP